MAPAGETLVLGTHSLTIAGDALLVRDTAAAKTKTSRSCFSSSEPAGKTTTLPQSIPLYNILWAEVAADILTIDYAEDVSKTRVRPTKLVIPVPAPSKAAGEDAEPQSTTATATAWAATLIDSSYDATATRRKRAYVIVNPHAGPGGAMRKFEHDVRPIFAAARMELEVAVTTRRGEAEELVQALDLSRFDVIAVASGDGLVYEVFNGLGRRADARRALSTIAIVHIPCGSGNAMACNLYGTHKPSQAALAAVKGVPTPLDLVSITQGQTRTLSFLSQSLGVIAEADLATDDMRWMGSARFTCGFLARVFKRAVYPCDVSVKVEIADKAAIKEHYSRHMASGTAEAASGGSNADDGEGLPPLKYGTINDKIPEGWETVSYDNMGSFYCGNMAYIMPDSNMFAAACIDDGLMDLVTVDGDHSPLKSIALMLSLDSGEFFDNPLVGYRKISAYRITPRGQASGYISIDGERVPFEPFQCEIHKGLGLVLSRRGVYESPGPKGWEKVGK